MKRTNISFICCLFMFLNSVTFAGSFQVEAQFWHPDSFHSSYFLPSNLLKAIDQGDTIGSQLIDGMEALKRGKFQKAVDKIKPHTLKDSLLSPYLKIYLSQAYVGLGQNKEADDLAKGLARVIQTGPARIKLMESWLANQMMDTSKNVSALRQGLLDVFEYGSEDQQEIWEIEKQLMLKMNLQELQNAVKLWFASKNISAKKFLFDQNHHLTLPKKQWDEEYHVNILEYLYNEKPKRFLSELQKAPVSKWKKDNQIALRKWKASSLYRTGSYAAASKLYKKLVNQGVASKPYHMLQLARSYKKNGDQSKSNYWYGQFQKEFPNHTKTAEMIWTKATKHETAGKYQLADDLYHQIDKNFKKDKRRKWANFRSALMYYKKKDWKTAVEQFQEVIDKRRGLWSSNGAFFFKGDALYQLGQKKDAKEAFLECINDFPLSYYAHLSRDHLKKYELMAEGEIPTIEPLFVSDEDAYAWVRRKMNTKDSLDEWSPKYQKTFERLLQIGAWDAANFLYASSPKKLRWRMDFVLKYSQLYLKYGYLAESYRLARRMVNKMSRKDLGSAPMQLYNVIYPTPHFEWVQTQVTNSPVDPLFVIALMRQESIFNDQIFSPVGAAGLMQIMTYTATPLAKKEGISKQYTHDLLRNPLMAIRLGTRYLKDLHKQWDGKYEYMLANYNAGPKPTKRWKKANQGKPDKLAFEHITYWETRDYIKKCMGNYWNYKILETYRREEASLSTGKSP